MPMGNWNTNWPVDRDTGDFKVTSVLRDEAGRRPAATYFSDWVSGLRADDVAVQFQYNIASDDVAVTAANGGSVTQSVSQAVLATGTAATGAAAMETVKALRYRPGHDGYGLVTAVFTVSGPPGAQVGVAGANQYTGLFSVDDGFFLGFSGPAFGVVSRKGGVDTTVPQSAFNLDRLDGSGPSGFVIDFSALNVFRIGFGWLGGAPAVFEVMNPRGIWIPFHRFEYPNSQPGTSISNPVLPMRAEVKKTGGATDVVLAIGCFAAGSVGDPGSTAGDRYKAATNVKVIAASTLTSILTLRSVTTFHGKANRVRTRVTFFSAAADGTRTAEIRVVKNGALGGTPLFTPVDPVNSTIEVDTAGTTVSGGTTEIILTLARTGSDKLVTTDLGGIGLGPGETLSFAAFSAATSEITIGVRWAEAF